MGKVDLKRKGTSLPTLKSVVIPQGWISTAANQTIKDITGVGRALIPWRRYGVRAVMFHVTAHVTQSIAIKVMAVGASTASNTSLTWNAGSARACVTATRVYAHFQPGKSFLNNAQTDTMKITYPSGGGYIYSGATGDTGVIAARRGYAPCLAGTTNGRLTLAWAVVVDQIDTDF